MSEVTPPGELGFVMPAEWERHEATLMAWPCRQELWGDGLASACCAYAEVARAIHQFEPVIMTAQPQEATEARRMLGPGIEVLGLRLDDSWARDIGPTIVRNQEGKRAGIDWRFNAWGGEYPDYEEDAAFAGRVLTHLGIKRYAAPFVLEGGSIHVDGAGTVLTSEQCLLNPNRNPDLTKPEIEALLCSWLGATKVIWLGQGLVDDQTDGHIDNLACFVRPGVVATLVAEDPEDANYAALSDNLKRLEAARDAAGRALEIVKIPQPAPKMFEGRRLARSYLNFYIANGGIVAPSFQDPNDLVAATILAGLFPDRRVAQVLVRDIIVGGGGIHCITQQVPSGGAK
jgi:agmatine deiminase